MDICIFYKYKVKYKCKYSYLNEYGDFSDGQVEWVKEMDGFEFIKFIAELFTDSEFLSVKTSDFRFYIEQFNPNTGEDGTCWINYEVIEED